MTALFNSEPSLRKFFIINYIDSISDENKFHFADTFELACEKAESIIRDLPKNTPIKIRIFEEILTYVKHEKEENVKEEKRKNIKMKW